MKIILTIMLFVYNSFAMEPEGLNNNKSISQKTHSIEVLEQNIESAGIKLKSKDLKTIETLVDSFKRSKYKEFSKMLAGLVLEKYYQEENQHTEKEKNDLAEVFFGRTLNLSKDKLKEIEKEERQPHIIQVLFNTENTSPAIAEILQKVCHKDDDLSSFKNKIAESILKKDGCLYLLFYKLKNAAKSGPGKFLLNTLMTCLIVGGGTHIN